MKDLAHADKSWRVVLLRYFNPVGAHKSGSIGEDPKGIPNNLMPYIAQTAVGKREKLSVFGGDYDTPDGTGVRDYIHVVDLAKGHLSALRKLDDLASSSSKDSRCFTVNLGTGKGYSVPEMIKGLEKACGKEIPHKICPRRAGDVASCYSNASLALSALGWSAELTLDDMCRDLWNWQTKNPMGYTPTEQSKDDETDVVAAKRRTVQVSNGAPITNGNGDR